MPQKALDKKITVKKLEKIKQLEDSIVRAIKDGETSRAEALAEELKEFEAKVNRDIFYFEINFTTELDYDGIWPDGDGPVTPTVDDVYEALMQYSESIQESLREWSMLDATMDGVEGHVIIRKGPRGKKVKREL